MRKNLGDGLRFGLVVAMAWAAVQAGAEEDTDPDEAVTEELQQTFLGFRWGLGLAALHGDGPPRIESARLDDANVVRTGADISDDAAVVLETHVAIRLGKSERFALGPFAMVNLTAAADGLTLLGVGPMVSIRDGTRAFNVGAAYTFQRNAKELVRGFVPNGKAPDGTVDADLVSTGTGKGWALVVSFSPSKFRRRQ